MDLIAPIPSGNTPTKEVPISNYVEQPKDQPSMSDVSISSRVNVVIAGCGGCGISLARNFLASKQADVLYFDTSLANSLPGESVNVVTSGDGSGGNRAENAANIERAMPLLSNDELGLTDVAIVVFSLSGGSGSVLGPLLIREYLKRKSRVIVLAVADTLYEVGANNTHKTLKTMNAIAKNNSYVVPMILVTNDHSKNWAPVDQVAVATIQNALDLLTSEVIAVDRNDRLNWIDPTKVVNTPAGIKLMSFTSEKYNADPNIILGTDSEEMVDSLLILQSSPDEIVRDDSHIPARLKKVGFYTQPHHRIIGKVSSDISSIDQIIDQVERMQHASRAQKHAKVERLGDSSDGDDLVL